LLSIVLLAFTSKNQLDHNQRYIKLNQLANARSGYKFRTSDNNIITQLKKGTRGEILEFIKFDKRKNNIGSGNYGVKIKVIDGPQDNKIFFVYYNVKKQNMEFYTKLSDESEATTTKDIKDAESAVLKNDEKVIPGTANIEELSQLVLPEDDTQEVDPQEIKVTPEKLSTIPTEVLPKEITKTSQNPLLELIPDKMVEVTKKMEKLSPPNKNKECDSCQISVPKNCKANNSYIEEDLIELQSKSNFLQHLISPIISGEEGDGIDIRCVRTSLETFSSRRFYKCVQSENSSGPLKFVGAQKTCITNRLASTLTKSFNVIAKCLKPIIGTDGNYKHKLQKIFEMINQESGFHTNVIGTNDDVGIGQMQKDAVRDVNKIILNKAKQNLRSSDDPDCNNLYTEFLKENRPINPSDTCERLSPSEGNPWKNMIYTFLYFKISRDSLKNSVFNHDLYMQRLQMNASEIEKIKDELAKFAHNKGPDGAANRFSSQLLKRFDSINPATSAKQALAYFKNDKSLQCFINSSIISSFTS
jgi:hypothetical protein